MRGRVLRVFLTLLAAAGFLQPALRAQDEVQEPVQDATATGRPFTSSAQREEFAKIEGGWRYIGVGAVRLQVEDVFVRADHVVLWLRRDEFDNDNSKLSVREVYAEGNIVFRRKDEVVGCHRLFLDLRSNRGVFIEATLSARFSHRGEEASIFLRAGELRQLAERRFDAVGVSLTTCSFGEPHYHVRTPHATIQVDPPAVQRRSGREADVRNVRLEVDSTVLYAGELPVFSLPGFAANSASVVTGQFGYLKSMSIDSSRRFGPSVRLSFGDDIEVGGEYWGEWLLHTQYLGDRGPGAGVDLRYETSEYRGEMRSIYQSDRGRDELFGEPSEHDRGRVRWQHRHKLPESIQLDLEVAKISDVGFLPEYYEREFQSDKEPETLLYLKRAVENRALTFLANTRINEFQDQVEYQPKLGYNLISEPLFDLGDFASFYFDADYEVARVRRRYSDLIDRNDDDTYRLDFDNVISASVLAGPIKIRPFAGFRYTRYGSGRATDKAIDRIGTTYGVQLTTEFWRTYRVTGGLFDLFGLRHIILPEIEYRVVDHVSAPQSDVFQFDRVDRFDKEERVTVGLRNRLETIWFFDEVPRVVDVVDLDVEWTYFPHADRDNFGENIGNIDVDFLFRPSRHLTFITDFEYSFVYDDVEVLNATVAWAPSANFQGAVGYRRYVGVNDAVFLRAAYRMSEKWQVEMYTAYDFEDSRFQDQRLSLRRIGHDWIFEIEVGFDTGGDDFGIGIALIPRLLFDPRLRVRSLRHEPEFHTFGDGIQR